MINHSLGTSAYIHYKDSGVEWIECIPLHWELLPIRAIFTERNEKNEGPVTEHILSVTKDRGVIPYDEKGAIGNNKSDDIERYKLVYENDLVVNKMNVVIGSLGLSRYFGALSQVYIILRPKTEKVNISFYSYMLRNEPFYRSLIKFCFGIMELRESLDKDEFKKLPLPFPPVNEQTAIARFLDQRTSQIDKAIRVRGQQITLLKERRQILIQNAVTRGLNSGMPMRSSGVEWIGEIPVHWSVKRAKFLFSEVDERSEDGTEELLSVSHMTGVTPRSEKNITMFMAEDYTGSKTCQKDDIIFNIMWAWMGALGVSDHAGIVSSSYGIFRQLVPGTFNSQYLEMLLKTTGYIEHYNKVSTGLHSSRLRFYPHMFMAMEIGYPSREEQEEIVDHIVGECRKLDRASDLLDQQITKLKEFKTTLINSAVTGKIKVPGVVESKEQYESLA